MINNYVSIDLETTGLDPKADSIIEIGAVKVKEGKTEEEFHAYINPGRILSARIKDLTGITQEEVDHGISLKEGIERVIDFIGEYPIMAHHVMFDYSFLKRAAVNQGLLFEKEGIDTLGIARHYLPQLQSKQLSFLCLHYGIVYNAHRALEDARATSELYKKMTENFYEEDIFRPKKLIYKVKKESPITMHQKERLYQLVDKHKIVIDYEIDQLTRNQASRYTDKILSEYGR